MARESGSVRLHRGTYQKLKSMRGEDETFDELMDTLLEDVEQDEFEERAVAVRLSRENVNRINSLAGKNVSANGVVRRLVRHQKAVTMQIEYDPDQRPNKPFKLPSRTLYTEEEAEQLAEQIMEELNYE